MGSKPDHHNTGLDRVLAVRCQAAQNRLQNLLTEHRQRSSALSAAVAQRKAMERAGYAARSQLYGKRPAAWRLLERHTQNMAVQALTAEARNAEQHLSGDLLALEQRRRTLARQITALQQKLARLHAITALEQRRLQYRLYNC